MKALEKEKDIVNKLIAEIEDSTIKTTKAQTDAEILNIEIAKKVEEVSAKQSKADTVVKDALRIKAEVEITVKENLNEQDIKAMAGILGNPPDKIKLILSAVACLNPTGVSLPFQALFGKATVCYAGIRDFIDVGGAGHKMKGGDLSKCTALIDQLFKMIKKDPNTGVTEMSQL